MTLQNTAAPAVGGGGSHRRSVHADTSGVLLMATWHGGATEPQFLMKFQRWQCAPECWYPFDVTLWNYPPAGQLPRSRMQFWLLCTLDRAGDADHGF